MRTLYNGGDSVRQRRIRVPTAEGVTCLGRRKKSNVVTFYRERSFVTTIVCTAVKLICNSISVDIPFCI